MQTVADIKATLQALGRGPKRSLGQNFLIDHGKIDALVEASGITRGDLVLEVGPGTGVLTDVLFERGVDLVCAELDDQFAACIRARFDGRARVVVGDCLERKGRLNAAVSHALDEHGAHERGYRLIANLPYQAASGLMVALAWDPRCRGQFVTIQKEVGERVRAEPGTRDYSELTVMVRARCEAVRIATLPPGCFWPTPKVVSEMVGISPRTRTSETAPPVASLSERDRLASLARAVFTRRRKTLRAALGDLPWPDGIDPGARGETLTIEQLCSLALVHSAAHRSLASE